MLHHALRVVWLGEAYLLAGRLDEAYTQAQRALAFARAHQARGHEAWGLRLLGGIASQREPPRRRGSGRTDVAASSCRAPRSKRPSPPVASAARPVATPGTAVRSATSRTF